MTILSTNVHHQWCFLSCRCDVAVAGAAWAWLCMMFIISDVSSPAGAVLLLPVLLRPELCMMFIMSNVSSPAGAMLLWPVLLGPDYVWCSSSVMFPLLQVRCCCGRRCSGLTMGCESSRSVEVAAQDNNHKQEEHSPSQHTSSPPRSTRLEARTNNHLLSDIQVRAALNPGFSLVHTKQLLVREWVQYLWCLLRSFFTLKMLVKTMDAWDAFKQDNYSTMKGDGGCRVGCYEPIQHYFPHARPYGF